MPVVTAAAYEDLRGRARGRFEQLSTAAAFAPEKELARLCDRALEEIDVLSLDAYPAAPRVVEDAAVPDGLVAGVPDGSAEEKATTWVVPLRAFEDLRARALGRLQGIRGMVRRSSSSELEAACDLAAEALPPWGDESWEQARKARHGGGDYRDATWTPVAGRPDDPAPGVADGVRRQQFAHGHPVEEPDESSVHWQAGYETGRAHERQAPRMSDEIRLPGTLVDVPVRGSHHADRGDPAPEPESPFPYRDGDTTVLGPGVFTDGHVITWEGQMFERQSEADVRALSAEALPALDRSLASAAEDLRDLCRLLDDGSQQLGLAECALGSVGEARLVAGSEDPGPRLLAELQGGPGALLSDGELRQVLEWRRVHKNAPEVDAPQTPEDIRDSGRAEAKLRFRLDEWE